MGFVNFSPSSLSGLHLRTREQEGVPFETSHVRILFPFHEPFGEEPDAWDDQLRAWGLTEPLVFVEVAPGVTRLSASRLPGSQVDVAFEDVHLDGQGGVVRIPVRRIRGTPEEPEWEHTLRVHAFAGPGRDEWRGSDELRVFHCPYPNLGDPARPILEYRLSAPLYVSLGEFGQVGIDEDHDMLADRLETELALLARPLLVLDEEEDCFFGGSSYWYWDVLVPTQAFFHVRPWAEPGSLGRAGGCGRARHEGRCAQFVSLTYVIAYQQDCGELHEGWSGHNGDLEFVRLILRSEDGGTTWQLHRVVLSQHDGEQSLGKAELLDRLHHEQDQPCGQFATQDDSKLHRCTWPDGTRTLVVYVAENKHAHYLTCDECDAAGDDCDGGTRLALPLTITYPTVHAFNVGEPDDSSTASQAVRWSCGDEPPGIIGEHMIKSDLGALTGGYYLEWVWREDYRTNGFSSFCGGMRSAWLRCEVFDPYGDCPDYYKPGTNPPEYEAECEMRRLAYCWNTEANPARFVGGPYGEIACEGGILEEKLSFSPWCPCEE